MKKNVMTVVALFVVVLAASSVCSNTLSVASGEGARGAKGIYLSVNLANDDETWGLEFDLTYTSTALTVDTVIATARSEHFDSFAWGVYPGLTHILMLHTSFTNVLPPGSGSIAEISFSVADDARPGVYALRLERVELIGPQSALPVDVSHGTFRITVALDSLRVHPTSAEVACRQNLLFTATGYDTAGIPVPLNAEWSVNPSHVGSIQPSGLFTGKKVGTGWVRATFEPWADSAAVVVVPGPLATVDVRPDSVIVISGQVLQFGAIGYDACDNSLPVEPEWSVSPQGMGIISSEGLFHAHEEGTGWVLAVDSARDSAHVIVEHGPATSMRLSPSDTVAAPGDRIIFTALASDGYNRWDVTDSTLFSTTDPGGSFSGTVYTAGTVGTWRIIGITTLDGVVWSDTASVTVSDACQRGDVNCDNAITPGDALCAFWRSILGEFQPECECGCSRTAADVNCDETITPGDALCIFWRSLLSDWPEDCMCPRLEKATGSPRAAAGVRVGPARLKSQDTLVVPIWIDKPQGFDAFGMQLTYPADLLELERVTPTVATENWTALRGAGTEAGIVTIGGFHTHGISSCGSVPIVEVTFAAKERGKARGEFDVTSLADDAEGARVVKECFFVGAEPVAYALYQNYPNPFNPTTSIHYSVVSDQSPPHVTLKIYNVLGQEVRTLVDEAQEPGYYSVTWDAKDNLGRDVSSGVYFCRLRAGDFDATQRMVLLK